MFGMSVLLMLAVMATKYNSLYQLLLWTGTGGKVQCFHGNAGASAAKTMLGMRWKYLMPAKCHAEGRCAPCKIFLIVQRTSHLILQDALSHHISSS